ncbi:MAG: putative folate metabolism gamma-glutamate ligase [Parcubacteria group bacterium]|nr:putative folate metabolism gamma-glutamate ligase [Parcubacteria group bacterium]
MEITPFHIDTLVPPKDDLLSKIRTSDLTLEEHDVIALSTKVVSIGQGRCVLREGTDRDALIASEADQYLERDQTPGGFVMHTITNGMLMVNAGIDPFAGYYVLWPEQPKKTAEDLLAWFKKEYKKEHLYLVLTDSRSVFLRRGVIGMAVAWAGFEPIYDNRAQNDLLGFPGGGSQTNVPDSLAASAVFCMGEANEGTPLVRMRNVPYVRESQTGRKKKFNTFEFGVEEDIFAPFLKNLPWKKGN